jgi:16S rRNA (guanine527-N7)-methyltransferase
MTSQWLFRALEESRARGYLGPVAIETQIEHAAGLFRVWDELSTTPPVQFLDLGSGGGLPGLVLFEHWGVPTTFVDSMVKRTNFLEDVLSWEGAPRDGRVINGRAEQLSREPDLDGRFPLVTARSFGPPAVTAECAARFLTIDGVLIVSEPPTDDDGDRWNPSALGQLGLRSEGRVRKGAAFQIIRKLRATPERFPREIGTPGKNPLF